MKALFLFVFASVFGFSAFASSGDVLVTCAGRNRNSRTYESVQWYAADLTAPRKQYLTFSAGSSLLLTASTQNSDVYVRIQGGLFEFDRKAPRVLKVSWNEGSTSAATNSDGDFESVTCYFQHED